jgi:hypothetical protein
MYTQGKILTLHNLRWPRPLTSALVQVHNIKSHDEHLCLKNFIYVIWKFLHHKEVMAWTSLDAHSHTQTLNSHFDNYVELNASLLQKRVWGRDPQSVTLTFEQQTWVLRVTHHPIMVNICIKLFCNHSKNKQDIDWTNAQPDGRTYTKLNT